MKIKMIASMSGAADENGTSTRLYVAGEEIPQAFEWQKSLASSFLAMGVAIETRDQEVTEFKQDVEVQAKPKRVYRKRKPKTEEPKGD